MRNIKYIILHCTAGPQNQTLEAVQSWWKKLGWRKPGYHHLIAANGFVHNLLPIETPSNGVAGFNANSINISYFGGIGSKGEAVDNRTPQQLAAMKELVERYKQKFPTATILGHRDFSPDKNRDGIIQQNEWMKTCPSFSVAQWLKETGIVSNPIMPTVKKMVATKNGGTVNLRNNPTTQAAVIASVATNTGCIILSESFGWSKVQINDKLIGFIKSEFLK